MARATSKTTAKKTTTATKTTTPTKEASIKELIEEVENEEEVKEEDTPNVESQPKARKQLDRNMEVPVVNVTNGSVIYKDQRTGVYFDIAEFGDTDWIPLHVLQTLRASHPKFLTEPWILIQDDEVVDSLGLTDLYKNILTPQDIERFFKLPVDRMEEALKNAPSGVQELIASKTKTMYQEGKLDSIRIVRLIQDMFNVEILED